MEQSQNEELVGLIVSLQRGAGEAADMTIAARSRRIDRYFVLLLGQLGGLIAKQIRRYGLADLREDAEQACAIGVHRAIASFDPAKARFITHVTWQIRGELQSLRHRVRLDQRDSAKAVGANTVSIDQAVGAGSDTSIAQTLVDEDALQSTERGAANLLTRKAALGLFERYLEAGGGAQAKAKPPAILERERALFFHHVFDDAYDAESCDLSREQRRQVTRRVTRHLGRLAVSSRDM